MKKRWCSTLWPTEALADQAGMAPEDFAAFVRGALFLDQPDPVAAWGGLRAFQDALIARLTRRARAAHGGRGHRPDARASRGARGSTPTASATCPAARSSPARTRRSANGRVRFTVRSAPGRRRRRRRRARAARRRGASRRAPRSATTTCSARWPSTTARACWARSASARTSASTRPTATILFDEKIGGTVHLALGRSYPETGGKNEAPCTGTSSATCAPAGG